MCPFVFGDLRTGSLQDHGGFFGFGADQAVAVELCRHDEGGQGDSLVAVHKGVVAQERPGQRGCDGSDAEFAGIEVSDFWGARLRTPSRWDCGTLETAVGLYEL